MERKKRKRKNKRKAKTVTISSAVIIFTITRNTVDLQWLIHLWSHENMFESGVLRANECTSQLKTRRHNRDIISIFLDMKVYCVYTQYTIPFSI